MLPTATLFASPLASIRRRCATFCLPFLLSLLAACGGGEVASPLTVPGAAVTPTPATVEISGTAATGAPVASGTVTARCTSGAPTSTTTRANGSFSISVVLSSMPCALRVAPSGGGQPLYSVAAASTGTATVTANITPLTSLAVSLAVNQATAQTLDAWFEAAASLPAVANALAGTQTTLRAALAAAGYTVPTPFAPFTTTFVATAGNGYDDLLEAIAAGLRASNSTFAAAQASFTSSAGTAVPARAPAPTTPTTTTTTPVVTPTTGLGATVTANINAALLGSRSLAFYKGSGAGCGTLCSFTEGGAVAVVFGTGNTLTIAGKTLSNPYNRILGSATQPHTPEIIWRDGNIEYALTDNDSGSFSEINVGDTTAPSGGLPRFLGQIRAVQQTGLVNVTQFAGTYAKAFQYYGPQTGSKAPNWTGLTITPEGAITFTGGSGTGAGPSLTPSQIGSTRDFIGCCGSVLVDANINTTIGDTTVNENDYIRLFPNAAGQLSSLEYGVDSNNYVGVLFGTPTPLPAHSGAAIPTSNQIAGTANGTSIAIDIVPDNAAVLSSQTGAFLNFTGNQTTGSPPRLVAQWSLTINSAAALAEGATYECRNDNSPNVKTNVTLNFTANSNDYRSTNGGRCQVTLTKVTVSGSTVTAVEGKFVAELNTFKRNLTPLVINDGVFRWVRP